jgi:ceramide glucosyltransferase
MSSMLQWIDRALLLWLAFGLFVHGLGFVVATWFVRRRPPPLPRDRSLPGVTVIKTCVGVDDGERELFDALFHQDYPGPLQLIFTVPNTECAANPVIDEYIAKYPEADAIKVVSTSRLAAYRKVDAVYDAHSYVKHELVIWSDSDVVTTTHFVSDVAASLLQPGVSMVSSPQFDVGADNFATALKAVGNNADGATMVPLYALTFKPIQTTIGHLIAFHKRDFDEIADELWPTLRTAIADDQAIGYVFARRGKRIELMNIDNPVLYHRKSLSAMINQKERHAVCQQAGVGSRPRYIAYLFSYAQIPATLYALAHPYEASAWALFGAAFVARALLAIYAEWLFLGTARQALKWFWTVPLWDLAAVYFVSKAVITQRIDYHGKWFRIVDRYVIEPER